VLRDGGANVALVSCRYGDCLRSSWSNILELVLRLDKLDLMPPALDALLDSEVWGVASPGAAPAGQQQQQQQYTKHLTVAVSLLLFGEGVIGLSLCPHPPAAAAAAAAKPPHGEPFTLQVWAASLKTF